MAYLLLMQVRLAIRVGVCLIDLSIYINVSLYKKYLALKRINDVMFY